MKVFILGLLFFASLNLACGVRGRPQPPLKPPELGRGEPSYKKAVEDINFPTLQEEGPLPAEKEADESE